MEKEIILAQVNELAETNLSDKEYKYIRYMIEQDNLNTLRSYLESSVSSLERRIINFIVYKNKVDLSDTERLRVIKQLDNKITYILQEL